MTLHLPNSTPLSWSSVRGIYPLARETSFDPQSDKSIQFANDLPLIQHCTVCSGASCGNRPANSSHLIALKGVP